MAKATRETVLEDVVTTVEVERVTLVLSVAEAQVLEAVLSNISGDPTSEDSARRHSNNVLHALNSEGFTYRQRPVSLHVRGGLHLEGHIYPEERA